jgi:hypothetical protein
MLGHAAERARSHTERCPVAREWLEISSASTNTSRRLRRLGEGSVQDINHFAQLVLDQAKTLYRYWPDVEGRLFE